MFGLKTQFVLIRLAVRTGYVLDIFSLYFDKHSYEYTGCHVSLLVYGHQERAQNKGSFNQVTGFVFIAELYSFISMFISDVVGICHPLGHGHCGLFPYHHSGGFSCK
jgi:hypothetical protein